MHICVCLQGVGNSAVLLILDGTNTSVFSLLLCYVVFEVARAGCSASRSKNM